MLTCILTTILFHSRGPEVRRPAGEFGWGGDTRRLLLVSQPSCRTGCQASRERRRPAVCRLGPNLPEPLPARPPRPSRRPLASPASAERPAAATSQCGGPAAAKSLTRRWDESHRSRFLRTHLLAGTTVSHATGRFTPRRPGVSLRARTALLPEEQSQRPGRYVLSLRKDCEARAAMCRSSALSRGGRRSLPVRKERARNVVRSRLLHASSSL